MKFKKYRYYIGIDSGTNTGYSIWDSKEKHLMMVDCMKIHVAMANIQMLEREYLDQTFIRVEDARLRGGIGDTKQAQGVGAVKAHAKIWEDFLTDLGANFEMCKPRKGLTKVDAEKFKLLTGWREKTNNHGRDAALLVFGM